MPDAGSRKPEAPVFGMAPEWVLADGVPIADAMVLSHPEQAERLRISCPEAAPTAVLAGDPCFDRMLAAREYRDRFRRALGVRRGQRLVLLNSTWNPESLFGDGGDDVLLALLTRLTAELPADEYRTAAVLHPNIWHGHGPGQIRTWLDRARRAGLALIDPLEGWQQALIAADAVIGDFGSVSYYAAALGVPVLIGAMSSGALAAETPVADFVRKAPKLDVYAPLRAQVDAAIEAIPRHEPECGPAELTTSVPGEAAKLLRRLFYELMDMPEPVQPALLEPLPLPAYEPPRHQAPLRVLTEIRKGKPGETDVVTVIRHADHRGEPEGSGQGHLAVHEDTLDPGLLSLADVIFRYGAADDPRFGTPAEWTQEVLARHPYCALAAYITGPGTCTVRARGGEPARLSADRQAADPAAYASALHAWLAADNESGGKGLAQLAAEGLTVRTGRTVHRVSVTPLDPHCPPGPPLPALPHH